MTTLRLVEACQGPRWATPSAQHDLPNRFSSRARRTMYRHDPRDTLTDFAPVGGREARTAVLLSACFSQTCAAHVTLLPPCREGKRLGKRSPVCSSAAMILPRSDVVTHMQSGYASEEIEEGAKASTRASTARVQDISDGQRHQNRAVHVCQRRPAAQENGRRRNLPKAVVLMLTPAGRAAPIQCACAHPRWLD
jgi:hypothetical protein